MLEYLGTDDGSLRTFHEKTLPQIAKALKCDGDYYDLLIAVLEHDAKELGINLIDADHFCTENVVVPVLADKLADRFEDVSFAVSSVHKQAAQFF